MIRFFTNYSYGGYEELYLGCNEDKEEYRYYLPLLANKKARLADDPTNKKLADEVERLSQYILIQKNGATPAGTLPEGAFTIISNAGYKTICRRLGNLFVVAISDVTSDDHDEMGGGRRGNPFTMLFVFDKEDTSLMDALLYQLLEKDSEWRTLIGGLFVYDPIANGLRFSLGELNKAINALENVHVSGLDHQADVPLIFLEKNYQLSYTLEVQKLEGKSVGAAYNAEGKLLKGIGLASTSIITPVPDPDGGKDTGQKVCSDVREKSEQNTGPDRGGILVHGEDDKKPQPLVQINLSREQIEAELRPIIRKEEREKAINDLQKKYQRMMDEKETEFISERKKLIIIAIGAAIGALIVGSLLFK